MEEQLEGANLPDSQEEVKQIIPLSSTTFEQILQLGLDLNLIYLLEGFAQGTDLSTYTNIAKAQSWKQTLLRKGYITQGNLISQMGIDLLKDISIGKTSIVKKRREKQEILTTNFDLWWKAYPATNSFTYKNRTFKGDRALRVNKVECLPKLHKILSEGEFSVEEMISALELEKTQKMEESIRVGINKMSYMQNSLTYLNQRTFEPFIELLKSPENKEVQKVENQATKRIDI